MEDKKVNFIKTSDEETRNKLIEAGFTEIKSNEPGKYVFLNCSKLQFSSNINEDKVSFSNKLCF